MTKSERASFIERYGLWSDEQRRLAADLLRRVEAEKLRFVRLAWGDTHGYSRAKTLTIPAFVSISALPRRRWIPPAPAFSRLSRRVAAWAFPK
jgi:hypothetical protein